jgi:hypothetical protein
MTDSAIVLHQIEHKSEGIRLRVSKQFIEFSAAFKIN